MASHIVVVSSIVTLRWLVDYIDLVYHVSPSGDERAIETRKPTGEGKHPESVTHAKAIDKLINDKLATRNINDDNDAEDIDAGFSDDDVTLEDDAEPVHTVITRSDCSATQQHQCGCNSQVTDLSQKLTASLDPETQRLCDEERATRSLQNTQIFTISQQLCDSNTASEALC